MAKRVTLEVVLILVITIALSWLLLGIVTLFDYSPDPVAAFTGGAPRLLFGVAAIALVLWTILMVIGSIAHRYRRAGWRVATHLVSLFVAIVVNVVVFVALAFIGSGEGGWGPLLAGIALGVGLVVLVAGSVSVLIVELVILRQKRLPRPDVDAPEAVA